MQKLYFISLLPYLFGGFFPYLFVCLHVLFCFVWFFFRETQLKSRGRLKNSLHLLNQKIVLVFLYIMILHKSLVLWCVQVKNPCKLKKKNTGSWRLFNIVTGSWCYYSLAASFLDQLSHELLSH